MLNSTIGGLTANDLGDDAENWDDPSQWFENVVLAEEDE